MKRKFTHIQIKDSGWDLFLEFVIKRKLSPSALKMAVIEFEAHNSLLRVAASLEESLYGQKYSKSQMKRLKFMGLSKQVGK